MKFSRSSGVLLHPTSLWGEYGIGDIGPNAYKFIDFLEKSGQSLWQILPLGPTSFGDSPYQSFSTFAGNPMLISPEILIQKNLLTQQDSNDLPNFPPNIVDYGNVIQYKNNILKTAFCNFKKNQSKTEQEKFTIFCKKNKHWLDDYCLFAALKDYYIKKRKSEGYSKEFKTFETATKSFLKPNVQKDYYFGAVWSTWETGIANRQHFALKNWTKKLFAEIEFYKFIQFEFYSEWTELKKYTNEKGIKIIGDIPIFVAYDSSDVWTNSELFYIDDKGFPTVVAGVPPDYFSDKGQLWGNPLYNWDKHKQTDYHWWISRIENILSTVDILRIDHFRGFENYWAVPFGDKDATRGKWCDGPSSLLFQSIERHLGTLPIIAEDLGIITEEVTALRENLHFPGMKVLQFAFDGSDDNAYLPHSYESPNTVVYSGTHDNDTSLGWYQKTSAIEQDHFRRYMNVNGEDPSWDLIRLAASSVAVFSIYPLQDILALDSSARMNMPSVASGNWGYRCNHTMLTDKTAERLYYITKLFARINKSETE